MARTISCGQAVVEVFKAEGVHCISGGSYRRAFEQIHSKAQVKP